MAEGTQDTNGAAVADGDAAAAADAGGKTILTGDGAGKDGDAAAAATADDAPAGEGAGGDDTAAEGGDGAGGSDGEGDDGKTGAPDKYELKAPEGMELDQELLAQFEPLAREYGLTNDAAQKLVDLYAGRVAGLVDAQQEAHAQQVEKWATETKADADLGGDKFDENMRVAQSALAAFGSPELKTLLNETGLGNHPEVVRFFHRVGKSIGEDGHVAGDDAGHQRPKSAAELYYPNMAAGK